MWLDSLGVVVDKALVEGVLRRLRPLFLQLLLELGQPHVGVLLFKASHVGLLKGSKRRLHPPLGVAVEVLGTRTRETQGRGNGEKASQTDLLALSFAKIW